MKKFISIFVFMVLSITISNAQNKTTYAEVIKHQTGWTVVIATDIDTNAKAPNYDFMPQPSKRYYVLPPKGKLFDSHIYAINYMTQFGFELIEVVNTANPSYIIKSNKVISIPTTTDWNNRTYKTINN